MKNAIIPDHYGGRKNPFEVIKIIQFYKLCFEIGNVIKYCIRAGVKDPAKEVEDLQKAAEYLNMRIDYLKAQKSANDVIAEWDKEVERAKQSDPKPGEKVSTMERGVFGGFLHSLIDVPRGNKL